MGTTEHPPWPVQGWPARWLALSETAGTDADASECGVRTGTVNGERSRRVEYSVADLLDADLPAPQFLVDNLVTGSGLTLLGGKPKLGKSWLALQITKAVATGGTVLGREVRQGGALFCALEDGAQRLQERIRKLGFQRDWLVTFRTEIPYLDRAQEREDFRDIIVAAGPPSLVVIDTLAAAKTAKIDENAAGPMADLANGLRMIAQDLSIGILLVHHHRKGKSDDPGEANRGSSSLTGAVDLNLGLFERDGRRYLVTKGRDIPGDDISLDWDEGSCTWSAGADFHREIRAETDAEVLGVVAQCGEVTVKEVANRLDKSRPRVQQILKRQSASGALAVRRDATGRHLYSIPITSNTPTGNGLF